MRSIVIISTFASLLAVACDSKPAADAPKSAAGDAKVTPPPAEPPKPETFGEQFCATIIPCFQRNGFSGNFVANVVVDIEPDGSVSAVSFTGEAPKPVQSCIESDIKAIKLATYNGKPGRTRCNESGQLMGGTQMVMSDWGYEIRDPAQAPPAAAPTPAGGDAAKDEGAAKPEGDAAKPEAAADGGSP